MGLRWIAALTAALGLFAASPEVKLPNRPGTVKLGIIGDSGTGGREQYEVAQRLNEARSQFPFSAVLMMGDNLYGGEKPKDYANKFEKPYQPLLAAGVKFYAVLGNHDEPNQRFYKNFNMNGQRYYTFVIGNARFFALDSNYMDQKQIEWLEKALRDAREPWKIAFCHHPLYSSGEKHGSDLELRAVLEPLFVKYGLNIALAGHEHFYERIKPQKGIAYFIVGNSAKLRKRNIGRSDLTAKGFDTDNGFMLLEIGDVEAYFQTISRTGETVDSGVITRVAAKPAASGR
jgi:hypothetical protein